MMQEKEKGSEGSENSSRSPRQKKPLVESSDLLCSDSNSALIEAAEEIKASDNDNPATSQSQSQLERSESGGKSSLFMSAGDENCGEKKASDENPVEVAPVEQDQVAQEGDATGNGSSQQSTKIFKHGSDGSGSSYAQGPEGGIGRDDEPPVQRANGTLRWFGLDISCEQEQNVPKRRKLGGGQSGSNDQAPGAAAGDGSRSMSQPKPVLRLFGVDIYGDDVQPAAIGTKDGGSSSNQAPGNDGGHGGGESSMQPPKSGFRLFGFDISK